MASLWETLLGQQPQPSQAPNLPNTRLVDALMDRGVGPSGGLVPVQNGMEMGVRSKLPGADIPSMMGEALGVGQPYTSFGQPPSFADGLGYAANILGAPAARGLRASFMNDIRPARESLREVADSNFTFGNPEGNRTIPIDRLVGGTRASSATDAARIDKLSQQMQSPGGYFERIIVDDAGNVLEGQHRLEALRRLGVTKVPVSVIADLERGYNSDAMRQAIKETGVRHSDHVNRLTRDALENLRTHKGNANEAVGYDYGIPQYNAAYEAAIRAAK